MTTLSTLPPAIRSYLEEFVGRTRRLRLLRAVGVALCCFLGWMLLWCAVDRFARLPAGVRLAALAVGAAFVCFRVLPSILNLTRPADRVSAAAEVERSDSRYGQRLVTVTSRLLGSANYRGSDDILLRLVHEVDAEVAAASPARLVPFRSAALAWVACSLLAGSTVALTLVPDLRLGDLLRRFLQPLSDVPAVTTTRLVVLPGDCDVVQSQPLTVEVRAVRLGDSPPTLFLDDDAKHSTRLTMASAGTDRFAFTLSAVDRDLRYSVAGGDARSPQFTVRVLRKPAVAQFRVRYEYPPYTRLPVTTLTNTDGRIEAPAGTKVTLTVTATEPLQAALLTVGDERVLMEHADDAYSRRAEIVVRNDAKYVLDLISTREVAGTGPAGAWIRAVPDLPPQLRLARGGDSLRLNPRDIVPVWYEALDDYGLKSLVMRAQVNGQEPVEVPVRIWGDPRRQQDVFNFDLATLPLGLGDQVKLTAVGTDTAGHTSESLSLQILVSPRSVDLDAYQLVAELQNAAELARSLTLQLEDAVKSQTTAEGQKDRQAAGYQSASSRADRALSAASQTATLLRQALLRATTHCRSPQLCVALAGWVDHAEVASAAADDAFRQTGTEGGISDAQFDRLRHALELARQLQSQLGTAGQGEQSGTVLADLENLQAAIKRPLPKDENGKRRLRETIARMRQDIAAEAGQIGLHAVAAADLDVQLRSNLKAEQDVIDEAKPVDFVPAAREWAREMVRDPLQRLGFEARLASAAQAEAVRADADLIRARDLELASRAAAAITGPARAATRPPKPVAFDGFVADVEAVQRAWEIDTNPPGGGKAETAQARRQGARARRDLARLAGDLGLIGGSSTRAAVASADEHQKDAENLALQAGAASADHQYDRATAIDGALARRLESSGAHRGPSPATNEAEPSVPNERIEHHQQAVRQEMVAARKIDDLGLEQQRLRQAGVAMGPSELAGRERDVAEQIAQVEGQRQTGSASFAGGLKGRDRAASEVLAAQEQLSAMPQALAAVQVAAGARRDAAARAAADRAAAKSAPADQRDAAERAAKQAAQNAAEASARVGLLLDPVGARTAQQMAERLEPFAPETDGARASILALLAPAFGALSQAATGDDADAVDGAANEARRAIESCQRELAAAQESLVRRDPLAAARRFARAAAESLSVLPPDLGHAKAHQASASAALSRAWDQSIHRAAAERLAAVPSLAAVLDPPAAGTSGPGPQQAPKFAAAREWGRLRPQDGAEVNASMHEAGPPGFEESLKLYFEALGKPAEAK